MKTLNTILFTISLLLGSSMPVFASDTNDEYTPSSSNKVSLVEGSFGAFPSELAVTIISSLQRHDQVSVRSVSRSMKELIDRHVWPKQSCTMKGDSLSSVIDRIKFLPFRSFTLKFKRWGSEDLQSLSLLTCLTTLSVRGNQVGNTGAEALSQLTGLTTLDVAKIQINEVGSEALSKLTGLTYLNVNCNLISHIGRRELEKLSKQGVEVHYY
ncbi:MAG: hypothetical protein IBJ00_00455 [Alphaproteobacteria bacterium]|nr:hypothetical protein [Alphaproteobacteria bacterium]